MGIVNAGQIAIDEGIPAAAGPGYVILNRRADATERLLAFADSVTQGGRPEAQEDGWRLDR